MTNRERASETTSSLRVGRCAISTVSFLPTGDRYLTPRDAAGHDSRGPRTSVRTNRPRQFVIWGIPAGWLPSHPAYRCSVLGVELDDQLLLDLRVDDLTHWKGVNEDAHLRRHSRDPGRHGALAGLCASDDEWCHLHGLATNLDDVVLRHPEAGDVHLVSVDHEVTVPDQLAGHVTRPGEAGPVHDVVQSGLQDAQQVLAGLAGATVRLLVVTAELLLQDAIDACSLLLLTHLQQVLAVLGPRPSVHARGVRAKLDRALRGVALGSLEVQLGLLAPAAPAVRPGITRHKYLSPLGARGQTRRRLEGRTPLCGVGVTSLIAPTSRPVAVSDRIAVSRPEPGPLTKTSTLRMPCSIARRAAASAAICAANGVDLREPLKPTCPAEAHAITFPMGSVIETMVLLNVLLM